MRIVIPKATIKKIIQNIYIYMCIYTYIFTYIYIIKETNKLNWHAINTYLTQKVEQIEKKEE